MINAGFSIAILEYTSIRVYQLSPSLTSNPVFEATLTFRHGEALREEVPWNGNSQKRSKSWIRSKHILTGKCDLVFFLEAYYTVASVSKFRYDLISLDGWLKILLPILFLYWIPSPSAEHATNTVEFSNIYTIFISWAGIQDHGVTPCFNLSQSWAMCSAQGLTEFGLCGQGSKDKNAITFVRENTSIGRIMRTTVCYSDLAYYDYVCVIIKLKLGLPMPDGFFGHANLWRSEAWNAGRWMLTSVCSLLGVGLYHSVSYCVTVDNIRCLMFL